MTRSLTSYTTAEIGKAVTRPRYCLEIDFHQTGIEVFRWCTASEVSWNGYSWRHVAVDVQSLSITAQSSTAKLGYIDGDQSFRYTVLATTLHNVELNIWTLYGPGPYDPEDGEHLFQGTVSGIKGESGSLRITLSATGRAQVVAPKAFYGPPMFNHIPRPNDVVMIGTRKVTVD